MNEVGDLLFNLGRRVAIAHVGPSSRSKEKLCLECPINLERRVLFPPKCDGFPMQTPWCGRSSHQKKLRVRGAAVGCHLPMLNKYFRIRSHHCLEDSDAADAPECLDTLACLPQPIFLEQVILHLQQTYKLLMSIVHRLTERASRPRRIIGLLWLGPGSRDVAEFAIGELPDP